MQRNHIMYFNSRNALIVQQDHWKGHSRQISFETSDWFVPAELDSLYLESNLMWFSILIYEET